MNDEIRLAILDTINKTLPAQVGEVLKQRLTLADEADKKIVEQGNIIRDLRQKVIGLETNNAAALEILKREQALVANEAQQREAQFSLDSQAAVLTARGDIINNLLERDERILGLVFGNNRFKYSQNVSEQIAFPPPPATQYNSSPQAQTAQQSRHVQIEGEGQVPVQPTGPITPQR